MELNLRRASLLASVVSLAAATALGLMAPVAAQTATPVAPPSAIGNEMVQWLAVSPAYRQSGLVVAVSTALRCYGNSCMHLWVSRDGGASWHKAAMKNAQVGRVVIGASATGHESLYTSSSSPTAGLYRSDDYGDTWAPVGAFGVPAVMPSYPTDEGLLVASLGGHDYVLRNGTAHSVQGSNSNATDFSFMPSPKFPSSGRASAALLIGLDPQTKAPLVLHCDATVSCSNPTPLPWPADQPGVQAAQAYLLPSPDYAEQGSVFAVTPYGISKSHDGGLTFQPLTVAPTSGVTMTTTNMLALAPGYSESGPVHTAYVSVWQTVRTTSSATQVGGIYRTTDGGTTWSPYITTGPFSGGAQAVAVAPDGRLFGGYYEGHGFAGLLCSTDGQTWQASCPAIAHSSGASKNATSGGSNNGSCVGCAAGSQGGSGSAGAQTGNGQSGSQGTGSIGMGTEAAGATVRSRVNPTMVIAAIIAALLALAVTFRRFVGMERVAGWLGRKAKV